MPIAIQAALLGIVQGLTEFLPVSSSAHVIVAEKLMGLDPTDPAMTFLLVMLHTGTMLAVIAYFWSAWRQRYFSSRAAFWHAAKSVALATALTGMIGLALMFAIERVVLRESARAEIEQLFGNMYLIAAGLGNAVIRLGHEMNGTWYHDSLGSNPAQYRDWATYYANIVRTMRSVKGAHFLFDWNVNAGYRNIPLNSFYPGNDVVDIIGLDIYDAGMPGNPQNQVARWRGLNDEPEGLSQIVAFARAHGKPLSFPEWGMDSTAGGGAGEDLTYIRGIAAAIKDNNVVYQSYFDRPTGGVLLLENSPQALRLWQEYFGQQGTIPGTPW